MSSLLKKAGLVFDENKVRHNSSRCNARCGAGALSA